MDKPTTNRIYRTSSTRYRRYRARAADNGGEKGEIQDYHKRWVLMESIRRTVMIDFVLQCLYGGVKDGYTGRLLPILFGLPVSLDSGRVWEALGKRIDDVQGEWKDQSDIYVEFGEVYTYEY